MKHSILYPLTIVLAVVTAVTLLGLAAAIPQASARAGSPSETDDAVVRRFYAAVNEAIATGDAASLEAVVWPDIGIYWSDGEAWGLADLRRRLAALHDAHPGLSLRIEELIAGDRRVVARVAVDRAGDGGPLGIPETGPTRRILNDRLRVADGRIVEYAGIVVELSVPRSLVAGDVELPPAAVAWRGLARVRLAPDAEVPVLVGGGPLVYAVEAGELAVRVDGLGRITRAAKDGSPGSQEVGGRGDEVRLGPGDQIAIGAGVSHGLRTVGTAPVGALAAAVLPAFASAPIQFSNDGLTPRMPLSVAMFLPSADSLGAGSIWPDGVAMTPLAAKQIAPGPLGLTGRARIAVDRLVLAQGRHTLVPAAAGPTVLAVESGQAVLAAPAGADGRASVLAAGEAASHAPGAPLIVHNVGAAPLDVLLLTLTPAGRPDTTAA